MLCYSKPTDHVKIKVCRLFSLVNIHIYSVPLNSNFNRTTFYLVICEDLRERAWNADEMKIRNGLFSNAQYLGLYMAMKNSDNTSKL
jgi:hypothetical protein